MNLVSDSQANTEMATKQDEKCFPNLVRQVFEEHNITEADYGLIHNLTGYDMVKWRRLMESGDEPAGLSCYCGHLRAFSLAYRQIHGYFSFFVCMVGVISNVLNIIVLTRREMAMLPINRILRGLAITDVILMIEYIPFIFFYYFRVFPHWLQSYSGAIFIWLHVNFIQIVHTVSIFMTLALACWRYSAIKYPQRNVNVYSDEKCNRCILVAYILPFIFCLPAYLVFSVHEKRVVVGEHEEKIYVLDFSRFALSNDELFFNLYFWTYFVIIKLVPCVILTVITCWLIRTLRMANVRRDELKFKSYGHAHAHAPHQHENALLYVDGGGGGDYGRKQRKHSRIDRTTNILIAVLTLFIITELPQGVLGLLSAVWGKHFFKTCYASLGDLMDILALVNGAVDFILYCIMSKQFRKTFGQLFKPRIFSNLHAVQTQEAEMVTTNV